MPVNTLRSISKGLGLNPNTLGIVFARAREKGEHPPEPQAHLGPNDGIPLYDSEEVEAWYVARTFEPVPKRGPDKQPRKRRTA